MIHFWDKLFTKCTEEEGGCNSKCYETSWRFLLLWKGIDVECAKRWSKNVELLSVCVVTFSPVFSWLAPNGITVRLKHFFFPIFVCMGSCWGARCIISSGYRSQTLMVFKRPILLNACHSTSPVKCFWKNLHLIKFRDVGLKLKEALLGPTMEKKNTQKQIQSTFLILCMTDFWKMQETD